MEKSKFVFVVVEVHHGGIGYFGKFIGHGKIGFALHFYCANKICIGILCNKGCNPLIKTFRVANYVAENPSKLLQIG